MRIFLIRYKLTNFVPVSSNVSGFVLIGNGHYYKPTCFKELFYYDNSICLCVRNIIEGVGNIRGSAKLEQRAQDSWSIVCICVFERGGGG